MRIDPAHSVVTVTRMLSALWHMRCACCFHIGQVVYLQIRERQCLYRLFGKIIDGVSQIGFQFRTDPKHQVSFPQEPNSGRAHNKMMIGLAFRHKDFRLSHTFSNRFRDKL